MHLHGPPARDGTEASSLLRTNHQPKTPSATTVGDEEVDQMPLIKTSGFIDRDESKQVSPAIFRGLGAGRNCVRLFCNIPFV